MNSIVLHRGRYFVHAPKWVKIKLTNFWEDESTLFYILHCFQLLYFFMASNLICSDNWINLGLWAREDSKKLRSWPIKSPRPSHHTVKIGSSLTHVSVWNTQKISLIWPHQCFQEKRHFFKRLWQKLSDDHFQTLYFSIYQWIQLDDGSFDFYWAVFFIKGGCKAQGYFSKAASREFFKCSSS